MNIVMFVSLTPVISDWPTDRGCVVSPVSRIPQFTTAPQGQRDFLNQTILDNSRHLSDTGTAYNITFNSRIMGFKDYVCLKEENSKFSNLDKIYCNFQFSSYIRIFLEMLIHEILNDAGQKDFLTNHIFRISLTLSCPMDLKLYPLDRQTCELRIASCECHQRSYCQ